MPAKTARTAVLMALAVFVAAGIYLLQESRLRGGFRIDEAHKIADTAFWGFLLRGDFNHPDWSRHIVDRTNPPVGKYLFGLSVWLHGLELPDSVSIRTEESGLLGQRLRPEVEGKFTPHLIAVRRVSAIAVAITAAVLSWIGYRLQGFAASLIAPALYLAQFLTQTFSSTAVYDPLLTLFIAAGAVPLLLAWQGSGAWPISVAAGALSALAFQTRLSGAVAAGMTLLVFAALAIRGRSLRPLWMGFAAAILCLLVSIAINPFYWATPARFPMQLREATVLLSQQGHHPTFAEKMEFITQVLMGDLPGLLMILGLLIALLLIHPRGTERRDSLWFLLLWCGGTTAALLLWLPLLWPRYLLAVIPPLALLSSFGWGELLTQAAKSLRRRRMQPPDSGAPLT